jgi:mono/diheme cytochrome c family protein
MSIDAVWKRVRDRMGAIGGGGLFTAVLLGATLTLTACGDGGAPATQDPGAPPASTPAATAQAGPEVPGNGPRTVADLFPEGEGRQIVLNNCASCHAVACAAMGQRPSSRWNDLREAHREHVPSLSEEELQTAFAYLQTHFNDQQPEPYIPPHFLERGCTPF